MNFYTLFTRTENIHLLKDVGMVPEALAENDSAMNSYIVTYKNGDYPYAGEKLKHTKLIFINKRFGKYIDGILFIKKYAKDIDVLNIYHLNLSSFLYCIAAKKYLKKEAKVYLKLDAGLAEIGKLRKRDPRSWIKRKTIHMADVVTGETSVLVNVLKKEIDSKIEYIPNGFYNPSPRIADYRKKKDRILTVGRLGVKPKNTELLVDAFVNTANEHTWELRLVGSYTKELSEKIDCIVRENAYLKGRICLVGEITDKEILAREYEEAKIFAFPSKWESFGIVLTEALMAGDYLLVSDSVPLAHDVIYSSMAGSIVKCDSLLDWACEISHVVNQNKNYEKLCNDGYAMAVNNFNWSVIVKKLAILLS